MRLNSKLIALASGLTMAPAALGQDWEFYPTPSPGPINILFGSGALADDDVWAVGRYSVEAPGGGFDSRTLTMRFDGVEWKHVPSPSPSVVRGYNRLAGVVAIAPDDALAVGTYNPDDSVTFASQTLFLRFDGASWSVEDSPVITGGSSFDAIGRAGADIWAMGSRATSEPPPSALVQPLAMRWTGSDWESFPIEPLAAIGGRSFNIPHAIDGVSEDDAWAVGSAQQTGSIDPFGPTLYIVRWQGSRWELFDIGFRSNSLLNDVVTLAPDNAWAVGSQFVDGVGTQPLILHWDGSDWTFVDLPTYPGGPTELRAIAARSPTELYASGTNADAGGRPRPFMLRYDGSSWEQVPVAPTDGRDEWFRSMTTTPGGDIWALGQYYRPSDDTQRALAQRLGASGCRADLTGDGALDFFDFLEFQNLFAAGDPRADFTGDGALDFFDFLAFQNEFAAGCA
ncbi:MAG: GC-type dockerin domain-anchored protein [Phycisphaerales bacterium JB039]